MSGKLFQQRSNRSRRRRATAATEFAIVLPLMMLFALACTDLGRSVHHKIAVANSARTAAEYGGMHHHTPYSRPAWENSIRQAALAELAGVDPAAVTVEIETKEDSRGLFQVEVTVHSELQMIAPWPGLGNPMDVTHRVVMRQTR